MRNMAEERFDFFNAVFLDTVLQPFHKKWFEFQFNNIRTIVLGPRASWKCVNINTLIPTLDGMSYMHELSPCPPQVYFIPKKLIIRLRLVWVSLKRIKFSVVEMIKPLKSKLQMALRSSVLQSISYLHGTTIFFDFERLALLRTEINLFSVGNGIVLQMKMIIPSTSRSPFGFLP